MGDEIDEVIAGGGMAFRKPRQARPEADGKVRTKARKKKYVTGAHGSGSARMKARIRERRANRHRK